MRAKLSELELILSNNNYYSLVAISEHWLSSYEASDLRIGNFCTKSFFSRKTSKHGGSIIMSKTDVNCETLLQLEQMSVENHCEIAAIKITHLDTFFINIYRPPSGDFSIFLDCLSNLLAYIDTLQNYVLISGDFNVKFNQEDPYKNLLCDFMYTHGLHYIVNFPTRNETCLDNIFTNLHSSCCSVNQFDTHLSDHLAIKLQLKLPKSKLNHSTRLQNFKPITNFGKFLFYNSLSNINWSFIDESCDANTKFSSFIDLISHHACINFPEVVVKINNSYKVNKIKWFDHELKSMRKTLQSLDVVYKASKSDHSREARNSFRKLYREKIKLKKMNYNKKSIETAKNKTKAMWNIVNQNRNTYSNTCDETCDITSNSFNTFFTSIASQTTSCYSNSNANTKNPMSFIREQLNPPNSTNFQFREVSCVIVRDLIDGLKNSNCNDIYDLNVNLIKTIKNVIISPLTKLVNLCIRENTFPECLKRAKVIPIYKKGDKNNPSNFRPIALLPIFSKLLEKVLSMQLSEYLESNNLISKYQFGFRKKKSTVDAVLNLYSFVTSCFESGDMALVSFLDLSKAFDCVSHSILAKKLPSYNLHPNSCKMLKSYLADRCQVVKFKNKTSNCLPINQGVPQGSILGPLLFIIFINDLPLSLKSSSGLYADDTTVKNKVTTYESIPIIHESALNEALEWFQANKLCLNVHKTQNMLFSLRKTETPENFQTSANFLGLHIDPKLCWSIHGDSVAEKVSKNIFLLRNLKNQLSPEYLRSIYFGICESHLIYGLLVWGHTTIRHRLFGLQRKAIRILAGLGYTDDCKVYFTSLNILTLPSFYILVCLIYVKTHLDEYTSHREIHTYETRRKSNLCLKELRLNKSQTGVLFYGIKFYNKLPEVVRNASVDNFKINIKKFLLKKAYYNFEDFLRDTIDTLN
jgi:hypothetical protein